MGGRWLGWMLAAWMLAAGPAVAQTKLVFGTDWLAQAEHGGFYQALAKGFYRARGLDVTIRSGGPQINVGQNIAAGVVDIQLGSESFFALNFVEQAVPVVTVAALFQKSPRVLIAHPGQGHDTLAQMKGKPIMISASARTGYWMFLTARHGFTDAQIRPYNFNMAPFLANKSAIQQGFLTSETFQIEQQGGFVPVAILLADHGFDAYSNLLLVQRKTVESRAAQVQAFVDASIEGWYDFLHGDAGPGDAAIRAANPEMTQPVIEYARAQLKRHGLVESGDAETLGIGAMTEAKWQRFFDTMVAAGLYKPDLNWRAAFTTAFVNQRHGIDRRR